MKVCEVCGKAIDPIIRHGKEFYPPCKACDERLLENIQQSDAERARVAALARWNAAIKIETPSWSTTWNGSVNNRKRAEDALLSVSRQIPVWIEKLRPSYRQLRIWGANGVGKTHLAQVLMGQLSRQMRCYYMSSEVISSLFFRTWDKTAGPDIQQAWQSVERACREADLLVLDELDKWKKGNKADPYLFTMLLRVVNANIANAGRLILIANAPLDEVIGDWFKAEGESAERAVASRIGTPAMRREYAYMNADMDGFNLLPWQANGGQR